MQADPQTLAFNDQITAMMSQGQPWHEFEPQALRDFLAEGALFPPSPVLDSAQERSIPGAAGEIPLRIFVPETVEGIYLHLHGGGWVIGSHEGQDDRLQARAEATRQVVVSVGYRLAPEDPYPAGVDDCEAAAAWLTQHGREEFGVDKLTIGGESAGGHLALVTMVRMREKHAYTGFRGAALTYGVYDLRLTPSARNWGERPLVLTTPIMDWFVEHFCGERDLADPDISPLFASMHDMPPAIFSVGSNDVLLDDTLFMAARYEAAGNETDLRVYPGAAHGFDALPLPVGREATAAIDAFLSSCLAD